jgi:purine-binding chemotaxis protein CheW
MTSVDGTTQPEQAAAVDWNEINRRLERAREMLAKDATPSPAQQRAIFKARARALAQEPEQAAAAQLFLEIIEFRLASETYGLESAFVREVLPLKDFTPLPGAPSFVLGIFSARGQILSIVDLKRFFNLPEKGLGQLNTLIILRNEQMEFGILADAILGARRIALNTLQASLPTVTGIGAAYLRGVTGERVIILDAEKILGDESIIVYQQAD